MDSNLSKIQNVITFEPFEHLSTFKLWGHLYFNNIQQIPKFEVAG